MINIHDLLYLFMYINLFLPRGSNQSQKRRPMSMEVARGANHFFRLSGEHVYVQKSMYIHVCIHLHIQMHFHMHLHSYFSS